jgi:hypothetical protein
VTREASRGLPKVTNTSAEGLPDQPEGLLTFDEMREMGYDPNDLLRCKCAVCRSAAEQGPLFDAAPYQIEVVSKMR